MIYLKNPLLASLLACTVTITVAGAILGAWFGEIVRFIPHLLGVGAMVAILVWRKPRELQESKGGEVVGETG